jgi:hypothetical protein
MIEFMKLLSITHSCDVEETGVDEFFYNGLSPDEVTLVESASS